MSFFKVDHKEAKGGAFEPVKPGMYEVIIEKAEYKVSSGGNDMIKLQMVIRDDVGQEFQKRKLFDNIVFADNTAWKVQQFLKAVALPDGTEIADIDHCIELVSYKPVKLKVKHEEYQGKTQERVDFYEESDHGLGGGASNQGSPFGNSSNEGNDPFANNGGSIDISDDDLPF
jgi:single-stranded DNA-binding protein